MITHNTITLRLGGDDKLNVSLTNAQVWMLITAEVERLRNALQSQEVTKHRLKETLSTVGYLAAVVDQDQSS